MRIFLILLRRELGAFFVSLTGYFIIAAIAFLTGGGFAQLIDDLRNEPWSMPVTQMFFKSVYFWMIMLLAAPVMTMRLFSLEKSTGTFETLMTAPVNDLQIVAAKFTAAVIFFMVAWLPLAVCLYAVSRFTNQAHALDWGIVGGMYLGVFLAGVLFLSFGCLASALTRSQMAAAAFSLAFGVIQLFLTWWAINHPASDRWQSQFLTRFNLFDQMDDFARGTVDTRAVIFYVSLSFFFLFLTLRVVESRRWK